MKKLILALLLAISLNTISSADNVSIAVVADTATSVLAVPVLTSELTFTTAGGAATIKFYDSATITTTYVQAAYTSYASYATNWAVVFTNENNVPMTNTFVGVYTCPTVNAAATNSLPALFTATIPASSQRVKVQVLTPIRGLTVVSSAALTLEVDYTRP